MFFDSRFQPPDDGLSCLIMYSTLWGTVHDSRMHLAKFLYSKSSFCLQSTLRPHDSGNVKCIQLHKSVSACQQLTIMYSQQ